MSEDEQIFLAAAILVTTAVGESHEPVGQALGWIEHLKQQVKT